VRLRRLHERGRYDRAALDAILDAGLVCHVAYVVDGQPYCTPTNYWRAGDRVYWHGSSASRMLRAQAAGIPVCLTVTHLDGLVLARSGFHHSVNFRSAMLLGQATPVVDKAELRRALDAFVERVVPGRNAALRPINARELKATKLLWMAIDEASAKIRTGPPKDDEEDYALDCWAGTVGLRLVVGETVDDPRLRRGVTRPAHLAGFRPGAALDALLGEHAGRAR
jgi:nitroimidazol reductase NimA-like FMN-containing flavoprotein (pyridoxamine 5'-phosphate oxidase superfamily)